MQARQRSIEDEDESVRIAVRALGDMRSGGGSGGGGVERERSGQAMGASSFQPTPALSMASTSTSPTLASPVLERAEALDAAAAAADSDSPHFVSRMSTLPIVNTALRAYEQSKASSRVVKYGAEMMESSVKTISRPVMDRLPVNQLDEFACRQLDRLGRYRGRAPSAAMDEQDGQNSERGRGSWESGLQIRDVSMTRGDLDGKSYGYGYGYDEREQSAVRDDGVDRSPTLRVQSPREDSQETDQQQQQQQQVAQRSRWQAVLLEAGGIGAAVSEESMRRLKYCLQWLQYATTHIDGQILILRDFMASLQPPPGSPNAINPDALISPEHMRQLQNVKHDVVNTVRQVVNIVSQYAGGALPEPARARVRGFILHLPQAWASAARRQDVPTAAGTAGRGGRGTRRSGRRDRGGEAPSRPASPSSASSPRHSRQTSSAVTGAAAGAGTGTGAAAALPPTAGSATQAAQRILTLATESLDMMRGVTGVVKDSLDRADAWVERLRVVGIQRQGVGAGAGADTAGEGGRERLAPPFDLMQHRGGGIASTSTSVTSSPVAHSTVLPPLRSPVAGAGGSSPLLHVSSGDSFFGEPEGLGKLSLGASGAGAGVGVGAGSRSGTVTPALGKKGMFAEEGEGGYVGGVGNGHGGGGRANGEGVEGVGQRAGGDVEGDGGDVEEGGGGTVEMDVDG
ncbi:hypothetical protein HETIRDRAFT_445866 [Heterobasidion irregulare TC 32-1]|uniref:Opi1-domain-containing protein n=1 Tax=Heterobasidion irregulare (strain TC 32-1) TaxID=747525 RepID=W4K211_HETIT|nr:uncharacterized protein HETIRDRAFT_445866 [Heterobasidion irregulare TC 32-1]ETW79146.1 hypothetical protein HETIRDRAFT_445866 [Heterobasidion irregulare TC 32-1]